MNAMNKPLFLKDTSNTVLYILFAIVLLGFFIRVWNVGSAEVFHDEGFYAFRSIGYVDYLYNDDQSTPIQWFKDSPELPWWTKISFHDHPPLFFIIQHGFFSLLGDSLFVARLPSLIAGIIAIIMAFVLAKTLFRDDKVALFSSLALSVNHIHIWISRSSIMESVLFTLILVNIYFFFRFVRDYNKWLGFGLTLGLIFFTKYIGFFLIPAYLLYFLLCNRSYFTKRQSYYAILIAFVFLIPTIIYNISMYKAVGHFDLQFGSLLHQQLPEWKGAVGKLKDPFSDIFGNIFSMYSVPFIILALGGMIYGLFKDIRLKRATTLYFLIVLSVTVMLTRVGSAFRFLTLYLPSLLFFTTLVFKVAYDYLKNGILLKILLTAFILYEGYFMYDGIYRTFPDFGIVKLDQYLDSALEGKRSLAVPKSPNPHLDKIIQENFSRLPPGDKPVLIIYDENIDLSARVWLFARRMYYRGVPSVSTGHFKSLMRERGPDAFSGYIIYFVKIAPYGLVNPYFQTPDADEFEVFLKRELSLTPDTTITGYEELPAMYVYKIIL